MESIIEGQAAPAKAAPPASATAAARVTAGYLLLGIPLFVLGRGGSAGLAMSAAHGALAVVLLALARRRPHGSRLAGVLADWLPLLLVPILYWELPMLMEALPGPVRYHDPLITSWEEALFRGQPAFEWAGAWPFPLLSELLHACYVSYYALIYIPPLLLYLGVGGVPGIGGTAPAAGRAEAFHDTVLALALCFVLCFVIFVAFPVEGPRYLGVPEGAPEGPVRGLVLAILERGSSRGAAFPSSHVAVIVTQALLALRHQPRVGRWVLVLAIGLGAGAVYGGFHYAVDVLAGAALGLLIVLVAPMLERRLGSGVSRA